VHSYLRNRCRQQPPPVPGIRLTDILENFPKRDLSRDCLRYLSSEATISRDEEIAARFLEAQKDREILLIIQAPRGGLSGDGRGIGHDEYALGEEGESSPLFRGRECQVAATQDVTDLGPNIVIRDEFAQSKTTQLQQDALIARIEDPADERVRINEQLHGISSSRPSPGLRPRAVASELESTRFS